MISWQELSLLFNVSIWVLAAFCWNFYYASTQISKQNSQANNIFFSFARKLWLHSSFCRHFNKFCHQVSRGHVQANPCLTFRGFLSLDKKINKTFIYLLSYLHASWFLPKWRERERSSNPVKVYSCKFNCFTNFFHFFRLSFVTLLCQLQTRMDTQSDAEKASSVKRACLLSTLRPRALARTFLRSRFHHDGSFKNSAKSERFKANRRLNAGWSGITESKVQI